jgi:hypothetical protein
MFNLGFQFMHKFFKLHPVSGLRLAHTQCHAIYHTSFCVVDPIPRPAGILAVCPFKFGRRLQHPLGSWRHLHLGCFPVGTCQMSFAYHISEQNGIEEEYNRVSEDVKVRA